MIQSMTGFGESARDTAAGRLRVEIRSVNHRFFNGNVRSPSGFDRYDHRIQGWLRKRIARGHVNCSISLDRTARDGSDAPALDVDRARQYRDALERLKEELGVGGEVDLAQIARFGDVFRVPEGSNPREDVPLELLEEAVSEALEGLVAMRRTEGARLEADLRERLRAMAEQIDRVEARAPIRLEAEGVRLREAIAELVDSDDVDEDRLAREMAYMAEKWDINEEIVRYRSHLDLFRETLDAAEGESVGKRLGFVLQEMHREANTIGSKANDAEIAQASVALKEEIERLREQLENIE